MAEKLDLQAQKKKRKANKRADVRMSLRDGAQNRQFTDFGELEDLDLANPISAGRQKNTLLRGEKVCFTKATFFARVGTHAEVVKANVEIVNSHMPVR